MEGVRAFIAKVKTAKRVVMEKILYEAGNPQFEFDVQGLEWKHSPMMMALLLTLQALDPLEPAVPSTEGLKAAEQFNRRRLQIIVKACRDALRSDDRGAYVRRYADEHGLTSYGRVALPHGLQHLLAGGAGRGRAALTSPIAQ